MRSDNKPWCSRAEDVCLWGSCKSLTGSVIFVRWNCWRMKIIRGGVALSPTVIAGSLIGIPVGPTASRPPVQQDELRLNHPSVWAWDWKMCMCVCVLWWSEDLPSVYFLLCPMCTADNGWIDETRVYNANCGCSNYKITNTSATRVTLQSSHILLLINPTPFQCS